MFCNMRVCLIDAKRAWYTVICNLCSIASSASVAECGRGVPFCGLKDFIVDVLDLYLMEPVLVSVMGRFQGV